MNTARPGRNAKPFLCSEAAAITGAWRPALASLLCRNGAIPGFELFGQDLESLPPLPKDHSQSAQDLVRNRHSILERGVHMKKLFLGSVALVALGLGATAAFAADRPVPAYAPPPPPVPVYTWTGCYIGGSAGYAGGKANHTTVGNSVLTSTLGVPTAISAPAGSDIAGDLNLSGFIGGFQGGCNYQAGVWVIGVEGDGS